MYIRRTDHYGEQLQQTVKLHASVECPVIAIRTGKASTMLRIQAVPGSVLQVQDQIMDL